jgi:hypothetical protein
VQSYGSDQGKKKSQSRKQLLNLLLSMSVATEMRVLFGALAEIVICSFSCVVIHHGLLMQELKEWHSRDELKEAGLDGVEPPPDAINLEAPDEQVRLVELPLLTAAAENDKSNEPRN